MGSMHMHARRASSQQNDHGRAAGSPQGSAGARWPCCIVQLASSRRSSACCLLQGISAMAAAWSCIVHHQRGTSAWRHLLGARLHTLMGQTWCKFQPGVVHHELTCRLCAWWTPPARSWPARPALSRCAYQGCLPDSCAAAAVSDSTAHCKLACRGLPWQLSLAACKRMPGHVCKCHMQQGTPAGCLQTARWTFRPLPRPLSHAEHCCAVSSRPAARLQAGGGHHGLPGHHPVSAAGR